MITRTGRIGTAGRLMLVTGVALGAMPILGANPAYACSCVQTDEQHQYDQATHVFKGTLPESPPERTGDQDSAGTVTYTFDVLDSYKGTVGDPQKVSTASQSAACGVNLDGTGPFLVFAYDAGAATGGATPVGDDPAPTAPDGSGTPAGDTPATETPATETPATETPTATAPATETPVLAMSLCGGTRPIGLNDQPTFGETPDTKAPMDEAAPAAPAAEPPAAEAPATEPPTPEADPAEEQGTVARVVSKITGLLPGSLAP